MPLPGSQKYRPDEIEKDKPWDDPLVVRANDEVPITVLLREYWKLAIPEGAESWKVSCPFAGEHKDGGADRQFRVYSSTNSGWCFSVHGFLTPVRLWQMRVGSPTLKDAARDLLIKFGIRIKEPSWQERFALIRAEATERHTITAEAMVEALQVYLRGLPAYTTRQFDTDVLTHVNSLLVDIQQFCTRGATLEEARRWLVEAQTASARVISPSIPA